jgi:hypothetical protein
MATFPALVPSGRTFTPGEYPHTPFVTYNGFQNRVRHSNVMLASQLRLSFVAATEANMLSILSHYQGQLGTFESFDLPSDVWSGVTPADYQLTGYLWRYIEPPTVEDIFCDRYTIELALETVPPDGAIVDGMYRVVTISFAGGTAAAASGLSKTVTISLDAVGFQAPGIEATVAAALDSGVAAASNGITAAIAATLAAGAAAAANGIDATVTVSFAAGAADGGGAGPDYWADMAAQLYGWEALAYIEWWGN